MKEKSKTTKLAEDLIWTAFNILKDNDGEMHISELMKKVPEKLKLDDWALQVYEKTGYRRWDATLHFFSIDCVKAGYLNKNKGIWYLTEEGIANLKLGKEKLLEDIRIKYKQWKEKNNTQEESLLDIETESIKNNNIEIEHSINKTEFIFEDAESEAKQSMIDFINSLNPYEFQDLCGALLRGMGYYTPFIAPRGKDGGIDIVAYKDPLGATFPRIKVQVKHREAKAGAPEVRQLSGILKTDDIGIFISTGGFSPDAIRETKTRNTHIELIDINRFIDLWIEFFPKMKDEDKSLMFVKPIYFLSF